MGESARISGGEHANRAQHNQLKIIHFPELKTINTATTNSKTSMGHHPEGESVLNAPLWQKIKQNVHKIDDSLHKEPHLDFLGDPNSLNASTVV